MEVLNAAGNARLHCPAAGARRPPFSRPPVPARRARKRNFAALLPGGLAALSSFLASSAAAGALTYEEALRQGVGDSYSSSLDGGIDLGGLADGVARFASENPLAVGGGALALAVPLILSRILGKPQPWGVRSARLAYAGLSEGAEMVDIREAGEARGSGSADLRGVGKKAAAVAFDRVDKEGFLRKLALRFKDPANTTLYILDKFDGNSELVAQLVTANGFKAAYAIKDGAEGPRGWKNSGLPWAQPRKGLALDLGDFQTAISDVLGVGANNLSVTLGLAAITGLGVLAVSEIETVLQLLGSAALVQFTTKKFLFAEDRKVTLQQIDEFLNTKVAPKELVDELKMIGKALLPVSTSPRASLPAPVDENTATEPEPLKETNLVSEGAKQEHQSVAPRRLSPYPNYPDFRPPSSPSPSPP